LGEGVDKNIAEGTQKPGPVGNISPNETKFACNRIFLGDFSGKKKSDRKIGKQP